MYMCVCVYIIPMLSKDPFIILSNHVYDNGNCQPAKCVQCVIVFTSGVGTSVYSTVLEILKVNSLMSKILLLNVTYRFA